MSTGKYGVAAREPGAKRHVRVVEGVSLDHAYKVVKEILEKRPGCSVVLDRGGKPVRSYDPKTGWSTGG